MPMTGLMANFADSACLGQYSLGINNTDDSVLQIAGLGNNNDGDTWLQIAGGANISKNVFAQVSGVFSNGQKTTLQLSGLGNSSDHSLLQLSVGWNSAASSPLQLGLFNWAEENRIQIAGLFNHSTQGTLQLAVGANDGKGCIQLAGIMNTSADSCLQIGILTNQSENNGLQLGLLNNAEHGRIQIGAMNNFSEGAGLQLGVLNRSDAMIGSMVGLVNDAENLNGFQIGLFNVVRSGRFPFTLLINYHSGERGSVRTGYFHSDWSPFQFALYMPGQVFDESTEIYGLRINLGYSGAKSVNGLDIGLLNWSGKERGVQLGLGNVVTESTSGVQFGLTSVNLGDLNGLAINPLVGITEGNLNGIQIGTVLWTEKEAHGFQLGLLLNKAERTFIPQIGGVNVARQAPAQFAWFGNYAEQDMAGPQISGFANITSGSIPFQLSAGGNQAGDVAWLQFGGLYNVSDRSPVQLAGLANSASSGSYLQLAGLGNYSGYGANRRESTPDLDYDPIAQISAFYNYTDYDSGGVGFQFGAFNMGKTRGPGQIGIINIGESPFVQAGLINFSEESHWFQIGFVNTSYKGDDHFGIRIAPVNVAYRTEGITVGAWNLADEHSGIMIGLFNYASDLDGLQIGLINIHKDGDIPLLPIINF